jgi:endogenous inhibitor of DNA gyrase (YacG/DUF329 family)
MKYRCPICKKMVRGSPNKEAEEAKFFPFCSQCCKLIDLGAWLDAEYKITFEAPDTPSEGPSTES